jgi:hypothetical protein
VRLTDTRVFRSVASAAVPVGFFGGAEIQDPGDLTGLRCIQDGLSNGDGATDCPLLLHTVCEHRQSLPGVVAMDSHSMLQYMPDITTHEQSGCRHFTAFVEAITFSQPGINS